VTLLTALDSAYPTPPPSPGPDVSVILGYLGREGETPHTWTVAEVQAACAHHWFGPIWCPRQGSPIFDGADEAAAFTEALAAYGVPKGVAGFLDVERNTWDAGGAGQADSWMAHMSVYGFSPYCYGREWIARWPEQAGHAPIPPPNILPDGVMGWQYAGELPNSPYPAYDLSIVTDAVPWWGKPPPVITPPPVPNLEEVMIFVVATGDSAGHADRVVSAGQHYILSGGNRILALEEDVPMYTAALGEPREASCEGIWRWAHD
jgi:hypothetical protein